ncbi:MAG: hypothetical protein NC930_08995, partial [Candidatus Omnitrophica bacterium]|nr:hypothetical protein [Candidatus Omnitrophota bacterium]
MQPTDDEMAAVYRGMFTKSVERGTQWVRVAASMQKAYHFHHDRWTRTTDEILETVFDGWEFKIDVDALLKARTWMRGDDQEFEREYAQPAFEEPFEAQYERMGDFVIREEAGIFHIIDFIPRASYVFDPMMAGQGPEDTVTQQAHMRMGSAIFMTTVEPIIFRDSTGQPIGPYRPELEIKDPEDVMLVPVHSHPAWSKYPNRPSQGDQIRLKPHPGFKSHGFEFVYGIAQDIFVIFDRGNFQPLPFHGRSEVRESPVRLLDIYPLRVYERPQNFANKVWPKRTMDLDEEGRPIFPETPWEYDPALDPGVVLVLKTLKIQKPKQGSKQNYLIHIGRLEEKRSWFRREPLPQNREAIHILRNTISRWYRRVIFPERLENSTDTEIIWVERQDLSAREQSVLLGIRNQTSGVLFALPNDFGISRQTALEILDRPHVASTVHSVVPLYAPARLGFRAVGRKTKTLWIPHFINARQLSVLEPRLHRASRVPWPQEDQIRSHQEVAVEIFADPRGEWTKETKEQALGFYLSVADEKGLRDLYYVPRDTNQPVTRRRPDGVIVPVLDEIPTRQQIQENSSIHHLVNFLIRYWEQNPASAWSKVPERLSLPPQQHHFRVVLDDTDDYSYIQINERGFFRIKKELQTVEVLVKPMHWFGELKTGPRHPGVSHVRFHKGTFDFKYNVTMPDHYLSGFWWSQPSLPLGTKIQFDYKIVSGGGQRLRF